MKDFNKPSKTRNKSAPPDAPRETRTQPVARLDAVTRNRLSNTIPAPFYETPKNYEAENHILGAMLRDPESAERGAQLLTSEDFYNSANRLIFQTATDMVNAGKSLGYVEIFEELRRNHLLEDAGGGSYLAALIENCPSAANVDTYIHILRDLTGKRDAAKIAEKIYIQALNGVAAQDVIADLQRHAEELAERSTPTQKRFNFAPLAEVLTRPDPSFLIHRLLVSGGTSLLTAKHASFKSFIALDMALCVSTGRAWHRYEVQSGPVIYIAAEGASGLKKRAAAWLCHHQCNTPSNLVVLDEPLQVADAKTRSAFIRECRELKPVLIILDTLARCAVGLDENNAGDMGAFADSVGALAKATGAHILTVHHNNKGGEYRGSSAVPAAVDTHLSIERRGDTLTLKTEKQKDSEELPTLLFEKIEVSLPNTMGEKHSLVFHRVDTCSGSQNTLSESESKVLSALCDTFGSTGTTSGKWKEAAIECGISNPVFYRAQNRLVSDLKAVVVASGEHGKRGAVYAPSPGWISTKTNIF